MCINILFNITTFVKEKSNIFEMFTEQILRGNQQSFVKRCDSEEITSRNLCLHLEPDNVAHFLKYIINV